mmetsp:Transcript_1583/g.3611  ORF Transcript_1583/g.3611 Transcript_1583/m.3611 type:complete len:179 (-) Transcript_1583:127-663(-)
MHDKTKAKLHSHDIAYGSGSGQQSVTGFQGGDDANSFWIIRGTKAKPCPQGSLIAKGTPIRLQHHSTRKWLHSHNFKSPLTNNQEVSCFGSDEQSDEGDLWKVDWDGNAKHWMKDTQVRLQHVPTSVYLSSHDKKFGRPINGQTEICGMRKGGKESLWSATEGVYFPQHQDEAEHTEL